MKTMSRIISEHADKCLLVGAALLLVCFYVYFGLSIEGHAGLTAVCLVIGVYSVAVLALFYIMNKRNIAFEKTFIAMFICVGLIYLAIFAPMKAPDEQTHYASAYRWSNVIMGKDGLGETFEMRTEDHKVMYGWWLDHRFLDRDYTQLRKQFHFRCQDDTPYEYHPSRWFSFSPTNRLPQMYLPATLGITAGRLLGFSGIVTIYLGRLSQLLFFALAMHFVMKRLPIGKLVLATMLMLPITLELVTSYSYDVPIIAMAMMLGSLCLDGMQRKEAMGGKELTGIVALVFLLTPCKVVYAVVSVMAFFIPRARFSSRGKYCLYIASVCMAALVPLLLFTLGRVGGMAAAASSVDVQNSSGMPDSPNHTPSINFAMVAQDPLWAASLFLGALIEESSMHFLGYFGGRLAWDDIQAPVVLPALFSIMFVISFLQDNALPGQTPLKRLAALSLFAAALVAIYASMLVGWTAVSEHAIKGVQGRYFFPLLPLLLMTFCGTKLRLNTDVSMQALGILIFVNSFYCGWIFSTIAMLPAA